MQASLSELLTYLLNTTDSLGVGYIDSNGLVIESKGAHAGKNPDYLACELSHYQPNVLAANLDDELSEQVIMGQSIHFYIRWLPEQRSLMYAMTEAHVQGGPIRYALFQTIKTFYLISQKVELGMAIRERLEQPRQFHSFPLVGHAVQRAS